MFLLWGTFCSLLRLQCDMWCHPAETKSSLDPFPSITKNVLSRATTGDYPQHSLHFYLICFIYSVIASSRTRIRVEITFLTIPTPIQFLIRCFAEEQKSVMNQNVKNLIFSIPLNIQRMCSFDNEHKDPANNETQTKWNFTCAFINELPAKYIQYQEIKFYFPITAFFSSSRLSVLVKILIE